MIFDRKEHKGCNGRVIAITLLSVVLLWTLSSAAAPRMAFAFIASLGASAEIDEDYFRPVRPIGVDGQAAWNVRSVFFMYPPTFDFKRCDGAESYRFTVKDEGGIERTFTGKTPNVSLAPVWKDLPLSGWMDVRCEALNAQGVVIVKAGERSFWKQAPFRPGTYPKQKRSADETSKRIARYIMSLPIVKANYLSGKPVPKEMVNVTNQVFSCEI